MVRNQRVVGGRGWKLICLGNNGVTTTKNNHYRLFIFHQLFSAPLERISMTPGEVTYTGMRLEAEITTTVLENTERWFMSTSSTGVHFVNRLPNSIKNAQAPKASKTRLKRFLMSKAFYSVDEFLAFNWETAQYDN
ncbi:hypothetical protein J6590_025163 [Homalodisca vitripennis]|nr:hypothetical protein J6590_025163 [Homalodisca vitripennis]